MAFSRTSTHSIFLTPQPNKTPDMKNTQNQIFQPKKVTEFHLPDRYPTLVSSQKQRANRETNNKKPQMKGGKKEKRYPQKGLRFGGEIEVVHFLSLKKTRERALCFVWHTRMDGACGDGDGEEEEKERHQGDVHVTKHVSYVGVGVYLRRIYGVGCGGCWAGHSFLFQRHQSRTRVP